ncbi:MAG: TonB family protein, partial [Desulfobulbaceae bacterium]|nr:TonB family protein [Desulfobulbaceae bacterium]
PEPAPVPEPVLKPVLKKPVPHIPQPPVRKVKVTERVKKQKVVKKVENKEVQQELPSLSGLESEEDQNQKETAAQVIQEASPLYQLNPPPRYPRLARRRGYEGLVVLKVDVDEYGRPTTVTLFAGSGHSLLDKAALRAVRKWRFQPGSINGIPQKMTVQVPVRFRLNDG